MPDTEPSCDDKVQSALDTERKLILTALFNSLRHHNPVIGLRTHAKMHSPYDKAKKIIDDSHWDTDKKTKRKQGLELLPEEAKAKYSSQMGSRILKNTGYFGSRAAKAWYNNAKEYLEIAHEHYVSLASQYYELDDLAHHSKFLSESEAIVRMISDVRIKTSLSEMLRATHYWFSRERFTKAVSEIYKAIGKIPDAKHLTGQAFVDKYNEIVIRYLENLTKKQIGRLLQTVKGQQLNFGSSGAQTYYDIPVNVMEFMLNNTITVIALSLHQKKLEDMHTTKRATIKADAVAAVPAPVISS